ncbi:unnamed protein product, partial [Phaeothamnion confervicola]
MLSDLKRWHISAGLEAVEVRLLEPAPRASRLSLPAAAAMAAAALPRGAARRAQRERACIAATARNLVDYGRIAAVGFGFCRRLFCEQMAAFGHAPEAVLAVVERLSNDLANLKRRPAGATAAAEEGAEGATAAVSSAGNSTPPSPKRWSDPRSSTSAEADDSADEAMVAEMVERAVLLLRRLSNGKETDAAFADTANAASGAASAAAEPKVAAAYGSGSDGGGDGGYGKDGADESGGIASSVASKPLVMLGPDDPFGPLGLRTAAALVLTDLSLTVMSLTYDSRAIFAAESVAVCDAGGLRLLTVGCTSYGTDAAPQKAVTTATAAATAPTAAGAPASKSR